MFSSFNPGTPAGVGLFIIAIASLIIVHEFGHYIVAKWLNIEVEEFGLGFPPRMVKLFTYKGTDFTLNWIPLGGFVRPKGENDHAVEGGLAAAKPWTRIAVLFAGPAMNFLTGIVLLTIIFAQVGQPVYDQVTIINIAENSPAHLAGLLPDDLILEVNGRKIDSTSELFNTIYAFLDREIEIVFERDGVLNSVNLTPRAEPPEGEGAIGILMGNPRAPIKASQALVLGVDAVWRNIQGIIGLPGRLIQGSIPSDQGRLVGFKGMFDMYAEMDGVYEIMGFFATISVSLGLLNLFPIPGLDGGRILFALPEIILKRRIPQKYEEALNL
ncbi:MAG: M50 family metallopeptidase, partial [Chloroflexota bacterium]